MEYIRNYIRYQSYAALPADAINMWIVNVLSQFIAAFTT